MRAPAICAVFISLSAAPVVYAIGTKQSFKDVAGDKFWRIVEGDSQITPQKILPKN